MAERPTHTAQERRSAGELGCAASSAAPTRIGWPCQPRTQALQPFAALQDAQQSSAVSFMFSAAGMS